MKRSIIIIASVLALSSCGSGIAAKAPEHAPDIPFSADAQITYNGIEMNSHIIRNASGDWEFSISEPYTLEGLVLTLRDGETSFSIYGMETAADFGSNAVSMIKTAAYAYDSAVNSPASAAASDSGYTITGTSETGSYKIGLDKSAIPTVLTADTGDLRIVFDNFKQIEPSDVQAYIVE